LLRYCIHRKLGHPSLVTRQDELLCSINARLGALVRASGSQDPGVDVAPFGGGWLFDLIDADPASDDIDDWS
jgi:hypothetical protein